ncbi:hypothetical protein EOD39_9994 [Acipenser ruthenus]|uniref:Caspase recruitment domain-containing protein n=1 Tax=Acipenser ruthenus TaxID=7906 RepID=A0A444TZ15_ACIRT|nr:hypothetical protein EOD39_9994 [Acipenser ruthenus]
MSFVSDKLYNDYIRPNMYRYVERIRATQEEINARNDMCGNHVAMQKFFDCLKRRRNWPSEFIKALKRLEQDDLASELEQEYTRLINPQKPDGVPDPSSVPSSPEENSRRNQVELKTPVQETATRRTIYNAVPSVIGHPDSNSDTTDANYQLTGTPQESRISRSVYSSGRPSAGPGHPQVIPLIRGATAGYMKEEYLSKPGILRSTNIDDQPCSISSSQLEFSGSVTENLTMSGVRQVPENPIRGIPPSGAEDDSFLPHDTSASSPYLSAVHSSPFSSEEYNKDQKIQALQGYQNPNLMESFVDVNIPHMIQDQHDTFQKLAQSPETSGARGPLENGAGSGGEHSEGNKTSSTEPWHSHHSTSGRETTALYEMSDGASIFSDVRQNEMHYSQNPSIDDHAPNQLVDLREESPQSYHSWSDLERPDTSSQPRERDNLRSVPLQSPENNQREPRGDASRQFDAYLVPAIAIAALSVVAALLWRYMKK